MEVKIKKLDENAVIPFYATDGSAGMDLTATSVHEDEYGNVVYGVGLAFALICFFLLPFPREVKVALMILAFSPFPSSSPAYTDDLKGDVGLSSALNSISIVCSITFIVTILLITL